ncbi:MAG: acyl-CoA dehydrogenase family protein [Elusimicrobia bacterium]|nr:acyl-CoA dehydrogenase family protein [Elusimicrobiota bacterium]
MGASTLSMEKPPAPEKPYQKFIESLRAQLNNQLPMLSTHDIEETFPWDCVKALAPWGVWGMIFPKKYGGLGLPHEIYVQALEEFGAACSSLALTAESHNSLCGNTILEFGTENQKLEYLPRMAQGEIMGAWALTEPNVGSDAKNIETTAVLKNGHWVLNGSKTFTTQGSVAGVYVIFAVTNPGAADQGISAFVAEPGKGLEIGKKEKKMGLRASDTAQLHLIDFKIPEHNLLGTLNRGFQAAMKILDAGRVAISGVSLGMARSAVEHAIASINAGRTKIPNLHQRHQESPGAGLTVDRKMISHCSSRLHAIRLLTLFAARLLDQKKAYSLYGSMAKLLSGELAMQTTTDMLDLIGLDGTRFQNHVSKLFRDAKLYQIGEGTSEIQGLIISRYLLSNPGLLRKPPET